MSAEYTIRSTSLEAVKALSEASFGLVDKNGYPAGEGHWEDMEGLVAKVSCQYPGDIITVDVWELDHPPGQDRCRHYFISGWHQVVEGQIVYPPLNVSQMRQAV